MPLKSLRIAGFLLAASACAGAATLGTVVPVRGEISDITFDNKRNVLYAANFTANRVEVLTSNNTWGTPIGVAAQPSAVAVSPDGQYLVVGHYGNATTASWQGVTIVNLISGVQQRISFNADRVLAVAFGNSPQAMVVTTAGVSLVDPVTATVTVVQLTGFTSAPVPVAWATSPPLIISGTAGVSGDGNVILALVDNGAAAWIVRYNIKDGSLVLLGETASPAFGPRVISVDQTGSTFLTGWALLTVHANALADLAQFPYPTGTLNIGGHAFDPGRKLIYGQVPSASSTSGSSGTTSSLPLFQIYDSDNLTVRETFTLSENLQGRAIMNGTNMYAISASGITVLPMGALPAVPRVTARQEDLFFQSSGCNQGVISQQLDIIDPGGNAVPFTLTSSTDGVKLSAYSGVTPATIQVLVDPAAFQGQKGTSTAQVLIASQTAVNLASPVRILVNTKNPDQQGTIYNVPGTILDMLADPSRDQFYVLRQDRNEVHVFNGSSMNQMAVLRTGNTPMQMAMYGNNLLVTNDNSQIINVFDLNTMTAADSIFLPPGLYARSITVANSTALAITRSVSGKPVIVSLSVGNRIATPINDPVYINQVDPNSVIAASPSGQTIFLAMPDGTLAAYDTPSGLFVASRKDVAGLSGAYAALSDNLYTAGGYVFNTALVQQGTLNLFQGVSSGIAITGETGLVSLGSSTGANGVVEKFAMSKQFSSISPTLFAEAPLLSTTAHPAPVGQIGQTILPFTRTLAPLMNGQFLVQLSTSGFTAIPMTFDAPKQVPVVSGANNPADQSTSIAPGGLVTFWGAGLSDSAMAASSLPLANALNNVCVYANSIAVPLLFVSPNQINAQLPFGLPSGASIVVSNQNGTSLPYTVPVQPTAPAIFRTPDGTPMIIRSVDGKFVSPSTPIHLNETLIIYMTGLGPVGPAVTSGSAGPSSPLAATSTPTAVYIGGSQLFTLWSGLAPGFVGVYQVNAQVPFHNVPTGDNIPFTVISGNAQTQVKVKVSQ